MSGRTASIQGVWLQSDRLSIIGQNELNLEFHTILNLTVLWRKVGFYGNKQILLCLGFQISVEISDFKQDFRHPCPGFHPVAGPLVSKQYKCA